MWSITKCLRSISLFLWPIEFLRMGQESNWLNGPTWSISFVSQLNARLCWSQIEYLLSMMENNIGHKVSTISLIYIYLSMFFFQFFVTKWGGPVMLEELPLAQPSGAFYLTFLFMVRFAENFRGSWSSEQPHGEFFFHDFTTVFSTTHPYLIRMTIMSLFRNIILFLWSHLWLPCWEADRQIHHFLTLDKFLLLTSTWHLSLLWESQLLDRWRCKKVSFPR